MPILPSKRARKIPEKIQVSQDDLAEIKNSNENQTITTKPTEEPVVDENEEVSLDNLKEEEATKSEEIDTESTNN